MFKPGDKVYYIDELNPDNPVPVYGIICPKNIAEKRMLDMWGVIDNNKVWAYWEGSSTPAFVYRKDVHLYRKTSNKPTWL